MCTRLYVGRLPYRATERDVERFFRGYGRIREVILKNGYCFVDMEDYHDAEDAVYDLNGKELMNERLIVEIAKGTPHGRDRYNWRPQPVPPTSGNRRRSRSRSREKSRDKRESAKSSFRLIIENLSSRVSWQDLKDLFRQAGEVVHVDAHGRHKNEGVVEFASSADMKAAMKKFEGHELEGRKIKVSEERSKSSRRGRSRSPRRDRSRTRSKSRSRTHSRSKSGSPKDRRRSKSVDEKNRDEIVKKRSKSPSARRSRSRSHSADNDKRRRSDSRDKRSVSPQSMNEDDEKNGNGDNTNDAAVSE